MVWVVGMHQCGRFLDHPRRFSFAPRTLIYTREGGLTETARTFNRAIVRHLALLTARRGVLRFPYVAHEAIACKLSQKVGNGNETTRQRLVIRVVLAFAQRGRQ